MVVGGNCPTVGMAGGYSQGGGHGRLAFKYGLAADQVLEVEIVTRSGDLVLINTTHHPDLFWALRGDGGSTFGIVISMTVKAYPDTHCSTAYMTIPNNGSNGDALYLFLGTVLNRLPNLVDAGSFVVWVVTPMGFMLMPVFGPEMYAADLDNLLRPAIDEARSLGLEYDYSSAEFPAFLSMYNSLISTWNVSDYNMGGRLIPRDVVLQDTDALVDAIRYIGSRALISGVSYNVQHAVSSPNHVSVNPYFRRTLSGATIGTLINYTHWVETKKAQDLITHDLLQRLEALTRNGAMYLNEADYRTSNFQKVLYGKNYEKLRRVKAEYDPDDIFYATTAVGSDEWEVKENGRLCRKQP